MRTQYEMIKEELERRDETRRKSWRPAIAVTKRIHHTVAEGQLGSAAGCTAISPTLRTSFCALARRRDSSLVGGV